MNHAVSITPRRIILVAFLALVAVATYGFAAANTVPASNAGSGAAGISGYAVTNIHYTLNGTNPTNIDSLSFTLTPGLATGGATRISLNGGGIWLAAGSCTSSGPGATSTITCNAVGTAVTALSNLNVVAAQ
ncbi:MAG: hypothetical protein ABI577_19220 [bacterium]